MFETRQRNMYDKYDVGLETTGQLVGGVPKNADVIEKWIKSQNKELSDEEREKIATAEKEMIPDLIEGKAGRMWTGFRSVNGDIVIGAYQVKAMLKELAKTFNYNREHKTESFKHAMQTAVHVKPLWIPIGKKPSGTEEKPIHVSTPMGPRSALKRFDYMGPGTRISFEIWLLKSAAVKKEHLKDILILGQEAGLGASRSQGHGTYRIVKFKKRN